MNLLRCQLLTYVLKVICLRLQTSVFLKYLYTLIFNSLCVQILFSRVRELCCEIMMNLWRNKRRILRMIDDRSSESVVDNSWSGFVSPKNCTII